MLSGRMDKKLKNMIVRKFVMNFFPLTNTNLLINYKFGARISPNTNGTSELYN